MTVDEAPAATFVTVTVPDERETEPVVAVKLYVYVAEQLVIEKVKPSFVLVAAPRVGTGFVGMSVTGPTEPERTGVPPPFTFVPLTSTLRYLPMSSSVRV